MGRKKKPFYRIVVTDSRKRRDGGWIESIGYYNPVNKPETLKFDEERLNYWLGVGAKMSERVGAITGKGEKKVYPKKEEPKAEEAPVEEAPAEEAAEESAPEAPAASTEEETKE